MFQSYTTPDHRAHVPGRLARLRALLDDVQIDGILVPRVDAYGGEDLAPRDQRLAWLTGFTGSAGTAIILRDRAALFTDSRYTLQAAAQADPALFEQVEVSETSPVVWLKANTPTGGKIAYDPWHYSETAVAALTKAAEAAGGALVALADNPIDAVWKNQPSPPTAAIHPHPVERSGESAESKRARIAAAVAEQGAEAFVLTASESVCWLLNIRGEDIPRTPITQCFAILYDDGGVELFTHPDKTDIFEIGLDSAVAVRPVGAFLEALSQTKGRAFGVDPNGAPAAVVQTLIDAGADVKRFRDPCVLPRAMKNPVELQGARTAHLRDGATLTRFLCWLDGAAAAGGVTEIDAAEKLENLRRDTGDMLRDISFDTISGFGPHAALAHYRVNTETNAELQAGGLYLIDSGGQYLDGTTDVTRTVAIGEPTADMRAMFTRVLQGMIAVSRLKFPEKTAGAALDSFARAALWAAGVDYGHGTGHGVGSYLSVHEGPQSLSKRGFEPLQPGMILSNEPGYYREGAFGIRTENLLIVTEAEIPPGGDIPVHGFETLTLAPIDLRLVDAEMLSAEDRAWLNAYHRRVYDALFPLVDADTRDWLERATTAV